MATRRAFLGALACLPLAPKVMPRLAELRPTVFEPLIPLQWWQRELHFYRPIYGPLIAMQQQLNDARSSRFYWRILPHSGLWGERTPTVGRWRYTIRYRRGRPPVTKWRKVR